MPSTDIKAKALADLRALMAGFSMIQELIPSEVMNYLRKMPTGHVRCFQLALMGAGQTTVKFKADGDAGKETEASLATLFLVAGRRIR